MIRGGKEINEDAKTCINSSTTMQHLSLVDDKTMRRGEVTNNNSNNSVKTQCKHNIIMMS